jgi:hypothetical protein
MFNQQETQSGPFEDARAGLNVMTFVARVGAVSMEVFLHSQIGCRYLGLQAVAVVVLIPFFGLMWPEEDQGPLMLLLLAYLMMCAMARLGSLSRRMRGIREHSRYTGLPHLVRYFPRIPEESVKRFVEPILVAVAGACAADFNAPLEHYLYFAAGCLFVSANLDDLWLRGQSTDLSDAVIEQQLSAERFRQMQARWEAYPFSNRMRTTS